MKFSYQWLRSLVSFSDTPKELAEFLTLRAFEVEKTEKRGRDTALDIAILPNRVADASGHIGLAREIAALKNSKFKIPNSKFIEDEKRGIENFLKIKVENEKDCPRYIARVIKDVAVRQSPTWLKERLAVCGLQSINNIVDAANYVMLETGQPLHVFDYEKLRPARGRTRGIPNSKFQIPKTIVVRRAHREETITALDEKTYTLPPDALVIADAAGPIAIAGIKGGKESGVSPATKTVVLEAANFDSLRIRRGARLLNLTTDASYRFEHGIDPSLAEDAMARLAALIQKLAGGKALKGAIDIYPRKSAPKEILVRSEYANRLMGAAFPSVMYESAFARLGFPYRKKRAGEYIVAAPSARRDIEREEDLVEEVIRIWGYEKITPQLPLVPILAQEKENDELFWERFAKDYFVGAGFTEVFRYVFTGERELDAFGLSAENLLAIENPIRPEYRYLAATPLPALLASAKENESRADNIRIFGITKSFQKGKGVWIPGIDERKRLVAVLSEQKGRETFFALKGALDGLFDAMGLGEHWYDDAIDQKTRSVRYPFFHPYRLSEIRIGNTLLGAAGELHPVIRETMKIKHAAAAAEIDFSALWQMAEKEAEYMPFSRFPAVIRDIAVLVPENEKTERVTDILENIGGELLTDSDLFDYFQDEALEEDGKKSLAFHLTFQAKNRTLNDKEIDAVMQKIVAALEENGWMVRK